MSKNEITGDNLISKKNTKAFEDNFDRIFGKKKKEKYVPPPLPLNEYPDNGAVTEE
jgi:hypothetical protein